eukprot:GHRR01027218.1.p1 GENE.GHRR01027218.1~~GHRR01027218.1.p1  ORF type:complete len:108 (+),score=13.10 GHRR01027218.1:408-731(+)
MCTALRPVIKCLKVVNSYISVRPARTCLHVECFCSGCQHGCTHQLCMHITGILMLCMRLLQLRHTTALGVWSSHELNNLHVNGLSRLNAPAPFPLYFAALPIAARSY